MSTVTVRFAPSSASQSELFNELKETLRSLETDGVLKDARIEIVFPGDDTPRYKGAFVISFRGLAGRVASALKQLPGIRSAHPAPERAAI